MTFGTFKKSALSEEIVTRLLTLIKERKLQPGDKLPPERELAATMEVSRPSLREALRALSIMNIIEIRQGGGTHVTSLDPELLVEHLEFVFALDNSTVFELLEARKVVEPGVTALAAERISNEAVKSLELMLVQSEQTLNSPELFLEFDFNLHQQITKAAQNPILRRVMTSLSCLDHASRQTVQQSLADRQMTLQEHGAIVQALKCRDSEAAQLAMFRHLNREIQQLKQVNASEGLSEGAYQPLKVTGDVDQDTRGATSPQLNAFAYHQLAVREHHYFYSTNVIAWEYFFQEIRRSLTTN